MNRSISASTAASLGAPTSTDSPRAIASSAIGDAGSQAQLGTTDLNGDVYGQIAEGTIAFAVDQQPFMQGYEGVEAVRLYHDGGYVLGGGQQVLTGPTVIDESNLESVAAQFDSADDETQEEAE